MNEINENPIKSEVYKCSKCGQCRSVCPVFLALKNEVYSPRGRFITLNNCYLNSVKPEKYFFNNLDICLNCNLCKRFCPSNIDSARIFTLLKYLNGFKSSTCGFPLIYKAFLFRMYLKKIFSRNKQCIKLSKNKKIRSEKILYFQGCHNKYIDSGDKEAVISVLSSIGYNVAYAASFCCGYPYLSDGNIDKFIKNIKKIEKNIPSDTDYILCSCDSCYETLKNSGSKIIADKLIRFDELLTCITAVDFSDAVWFKTLSRNEKLSLPVNFLDNIGICSGGENFLDFKHPDFADIISKNTKKIISELNENYVLTTCNITNRALKNYVKDKKIMSLSEYLVMKLPH